MPSKTPESVVQTLQAMVRIDSVNSTVCGKPRAEAELGNWIETAAKRLGLETRRLPIQGKADQLLVTHQVSPDAPWLLFDSHMDTVAVGGMSVEPFGGVLRDGRIYGRGACDTKGTGAAMLWALYQYAQSPGPNNVAILFGVDEEHGMHGVRAFLKQDYPKLGFEPVGVIVGEPTELHPVVAHHGLLRWQITTRGIAAHSSVPHEGRSAISMMVRLIHAIETQYIPGVTAEHELAGPAACSVNRVHGGTAPNIIPDRCTADVDRRVAPGEDVATILPAVIEVLDRCKADDPTLDYMIEVLISHPPLLPVGQDALLAATTATLKQLSLPALVLGAPFCTHASYYHAAGLPVIVLGPGEAHKAHTRDEYISVEQLEHGLDLYLHLMQSHIAPV